MFGVKDLNVSAIGSEYVEILSDGLRVDGIVSPVDCLSAAQGGGERAMKSVVILRGESEDGECGLGADYVN